MFEHKLDFYLQHRNIIAIKVHFCTFIAMMQFTSRGYEKNWSVFTLSSIKFISSIFKYRARIRLFKEFVFIFIPMKAFLRFIDRQHNSDSSHM